MDLVVLLKEAAAPVMQGQMPPPELVKALISKGLGYCILAGACITKLPQILAVVNSGSAVGLAPLATELEVVGLAVHSSYGALHQLPFSAYGEAAILCAQSVLLLALIYRLARISPLRVALVAGALAAFGASVTTGYVGVDIIDVLFNANNLVFMAARVPQIITNFRSRATGQLSLTTCAINLVGCIVRIYTSIADNAGAAMVRQYIISLVLNGALVVQILLYAKNTKAAAAKASKKKAQ